MATTRRRRAARAEAAARIALIAGVFSVVLAWLTPIIAPLAIVGFLLALPGVRWAHHDRLVVWWALGLNLAAIACCVVWAFWMVPQLDLG